MAPQAGLEPATYRLTAGRSTIELLRNAILERVKGIEPSHSAWKADVLPLNYTRIWSGRRDSNPRPSPWQGDALPLSHFREWWFGTESNRRHEDFQSSALPTELPSLIKWRRERDSNPRGGVCPPTRFPIVLLRPLGHLSVSSHPKISYLLISYCLSC